MTKIIMKVLCSVRFGGTESGNGHDRIARCRGTCMPKPTWIVVSCDLLSEVFKNVEFCTLAASNGSHVTLSQHLLSFFSELLKTVFGKMPVFNILNYLAFHLMPS